jgi:RES domain-containing protein
MAKLILKQRIARAFVSAGRYDGYCYRNVPSTYAKPSGFLSTKRTRESGGRYNYKGELNALYLSLDPHTCLEESVRAMRISGFDLAARFPRDISAFEVHLEKVLNLADPKVRRGLGVSRTALTREDEWKEYQYRGRLALTQKIGRYASEIGFEGLLVPSAVCGGVNLVVLTDNVNSPSEFKLLR